MGLVSQYYPRLSMVDCDLENLTWGQPPTSPEGFAGPRAWGVGESRSDHPGRILTGAIRR